MYRKIIALATMMILVLSSANQLFSQGFRLGLKVSPSVSWFKPDTDDYISGGIRAGFSYGLLSEFILAEQYSFATGIHINYQGGILEFPTTETIDGATYITKERTYRLQHIEIPFTLKMKTREIGYNTYFAVFGFGGSANLRARADYHFASEDDNNPGITISDIDIKSDIPLFRVSMILGVGFEHSLGGTTSIVTNVNFNNGFTNTLKGENIVNGKQKNSIANFVELSVGVLF